MPLRWKRRRVEKGGKIVSRLRKEDVPRSTAGRRKEGATLFLGLGIIKKQQHLMRWRE